MNQLVDTGQFKSTSDKLQTLKETLSNIRGHITEYKQTVQSPEFKGNNTQVLNFEQIQEVTKEKRNTRGSLDVEKTRNSFWPIGSKKGSIPVSVLTSTTFDGRRQSQ